MFDNIGGKIKTTAEVFCWIGIAVSFFGGAFCISFDYGMMGLFMFLLVAGLGSLFSWIGSFCLYGFGELIEQTTKSAYHAHMSYITLRQIVNNQDE